MRWRRRGRRRRFRERADRTWRGSPERFDVEYLRRWPPVYLHLCSPNPSTSSSGRNAIVRRLPANYASGMLRRVAVLAFPDVAMFELGVLCEVFGTDRSDDGFPSYEFSVCTPDGKPVRNRSGFSIAPHGDLSGLVDADLVCVPAYADALNGKWQPDGIAALRAAYDRGAQILSVCSGAFALGEAGLLDGRSCTTHWQYACQLAERYPMAEVRPDVLYVEDGNVFTSAGTAAGIDLCLHLVRREHGSAVARKLARRMVVPPHRDGGQSQYVEAQPASTESG